MKPRALKLGDRVRVVRLPPMWATPGCRVPASTRRIYKLMISRRRAVRIFEVNYTGAWVRELVRGWGGRLEHHHITLDDGCWVRVRHRNVSGT
jgi:hypothetical protein